MFKKVLKYSRSYIDYLASDEWLLKRALVLKDNAKCAWCKKTKNLQLHHLHYDNLFDEKPEDFLVLCFRCHKKLHGKPQRKKLKIQSKLKELPKEERRKLYYNRQVKRLKKKSFSCSKYDKRIDKSRIAHRKVDYADSYYKL